MAAATEIVGVNTQEKKRDQMFQRIKESFAKQKNCHVDIVFYMQSVEQQLRDAHLESMMSSSIFNYATAFHYFASTQQKPIWARFPRLGTYFSTQAIYACISVKVSDKPDERKIICGIFDPDCEQMIRAEITKYAEEFSVTDITFVKDSV